METIKAKFKEFVIDSNIGENTFICKHNKTKYFLRKFDPKTIEGIALVQSLKKLSDNGIKIPKIIAINKKKGFVISQYLKGTKVIDLISDADLNENVYSQLFVVAYMARINKMTLNYEPDNWMMANDTLYYLNPFYIPYDPKKDLIERYLPLYFNTKQLKQYMENMNVFYDKKRVKPEYETNKEMAMMACKYYR